MTLFQDLQTSLDQGQGQLRSLVDIGERTIQHTSETGAKEIEEQLGLLKAEYQRLRDSLGEARNDLELAHTQWNSFDNAHSQLSTWIKEVEGKLRSDVAGNKTDLAEKKAQVEKVKVNVGQYMYLYFQLVVQNLRTLIVMHEYSSTRKL